MYVTINSRSDVHWESPTYRETQIADMLIMNDPLVITKDILINYLGAFFRISKADHSFPSTGPSTGRPKSQCG